MNEIIIILNIYRYINCFLLAKQFILYLDKGKNSLAICEI